jgi:hypothetical protein
MKPVLTCLTLAAMLPGIALAQTQQPVPPMQYFPASPIAPTARPSIPGVTYTPQGYPIIRGPAPGEIYIVCMKNIQKGLVELTDPEVRKSALDHAAAACAAAG